MSKSRSHHSPLFRRRQLMGGGLGIVSGLGLGGLWAQGQQQRIQAVTLQDLGWAVGIGEDPDKYVSEVERDPYVAMIEASWRPQFLTGWVNSFDHRNGDLSYWRDWYRSRKFHQWFEQGYGLQVITWENDENRPSGDYHISPQFVADMGELAGYIALANPQQRPTYWTLATEFSYWRIPADTYNEDTSEYYQALMANVLRARDAIKEKLPNAWVALCWGGWIATYDAPNQGWGRSMVVPFAETMRQMDGIAFQSMRRYRQYEYNPDLDYLDPGNPDQIRLCCELFSPINSNLMLAHYEPSIKNEHPYGGRAEAVVTDFELMSNPGWLAYVTMLGLRKMSLMHYGLYKGDPYRCLTAASRFRSQIEAIHCPVWV